MDFRKEREYLIEHPINDCHRLVCTKVTKNTKGEVISYIFTNPVIENSRYEFTLEEVKAFNDVREPVDNTELFQMYINWLNFRRDGIHQDLIFAEQLRLKIINTLQNRTHVHYGAGALVEYDHVRIEKILENEL